MVQDFTASMRELWDSDHGEILGIYSPAERMCGKIAEQALKANGGKSFTYLEAGLLEGMDIDPYGSIVFQDSADTLSTLTLNKTSQYTFRQEEDEEGRYQAFDSFRATHFKASVLEHYRKTNGEFFFEIFKSATNRYDDGDLEGTAGNPITLSKTNIDSFAFELSAKLEEEGEEGGGFSTALTPKLLSKVNLAAFGSGAKPTDDAFKGMLNLGIENSFAGSYFEVDFYKTTLIPQGQKITYTDNPTAAKTFTFNGVVLTAVAALNGGDGEFLIAATDDETYANMASLLINPAIDTAGA